MVIYPQEVTMKRFNKILLEIGLVSCIVVCILMYFVIYRISRSFVFWNPDLAFMQMPLYTFSILIITGVIGALSLALFLVHRSTKENIFQRLTIKALYWVGHSLGFAFLMSLAFFGYAYYHLAKGMGLPGGYVGIFVLITFVGTNVMYFIAVLFKQAVEYKEENQLTV